MSVIETLPATSGPSRAAIAARPRRKDPVLPALIVPAFVLYGIFVLAALAIALILSFVHWPVGGAISFAGFANWSEFFSGPGLHSLAVTGEVIGISLALQIPLSLALGIFAAGPQRYRAVLSWIYVLPLLVSPTGIAITWARFFDPTFGALSPVMQQAWLSNGHLAPVIVTAVFTWRIVPFYVILVQSAVRTIPKELTEAALLDGASNAQRLRYIILPQLRHTVVVVTILCITGALTAFDLYYVTTGGGPNGATSTLAVSVYLKAFADQALGAASVYAVVVAGLGVAMAGLVSRMTRFGTMESQR